MRARGTHRILEWFRACRATRRLREGIWQRDALLRKVGRIAAATEGQRLPAGAWRAHGEAAYRRFKWDPGQVPAGAQGICRQLAVLETHISELVRQIGPPPFKDPTSPPPPGRRLAVALSPGPPR